jgi:transposase
MQHAGCGFISHVFAMENLVPANRSQLLLLPPSLQEWVPEDDLVHFVIEAVEAMPLPTLSVNARGTGSAQYPPRMMLELLIYCYANGIFSSRRIERATYRDVSVRYLTADTHPDHDTIAAFRRGNQEAVSTCFVEVLKLAKQMQLLKVGTVSVDGTKLKANASKDKNIRYDRAVQLEAQLTADVRELLAKAESADASGEVDGTRLPKEVNRLSKLKRKMQEAREELERRNRERVEAEKREYEAKLAGRQEREGGDKGGPPQPPSDEQRQDEQCNLTDKESRILRPSTREGFVQGYNAQACVDAGGTFLIVGQRISQCASDAHELVRSLETISPEVGKAARVLADKGYASRETIETLEEREVDAYIAVEAEGTMQARRYDFRPPKEGKVPRQGPMKPWNARMAEKLRTDGGRRLYRLRKQTVEPVFGIIKQAIGFRQFLLRGLQKVEGEWSLVCLAYNFRRLHTLSRA